MGEKKNGEGNNLTAVYVKIFRFFTFCGTKNVSSLIFYKGPLI